jgi:hypothetical protein
MDAIITDFNGNRMSLNGIAWHNASPKPIHLRRRFRKAGAVFLGIEIYKED